MKHQKSRLSHLTRTPRLREQILKFSIEIGLLFGILTLFDQFIFPGSLSAVQPHPYWAVIVIMAVQRGLLGGLASALIASALFIAQTASTPSLMTGFYEHQAAILLLPALWFATGAMIGGLRTRQANSYRDLRSELDQAAENNDLLANSLVTSSRRSQMLELQLASGPNSSPTDTDAPIDLPMAPRHPTLVSALASDHPIYLWPAPAQHLEATHIGATPFWRSMTMSRTGDETGMAKTDYALPSNTGAPIVNPDSNNVILDEPIDAKQTSPTNGRATPLKTTQATVKHLGNRAIAS